MASIKIKFRTSNVHHNNGVIYFQIIHKRIVRQLATSYRINASEWDASTQRILPVAPSLNKERHHYLAVISDKLACEYRLLCRIVESFDRKAEEYSADSIINSYRMMSKEYTLSAFMSRTIIQMKRNGSPAKPCGLSIDSRKSKQEEFSVYDASELRSELFDFSIERVSGCIGRTVDKIV